VDVGAYMAERIPLIDSAIESRFGVLSRCESIAPARVGMDGLSSGEVPDALLGAMRHLLFPGGKRLRPVLALASAEAVGGPATAALPLGVAVEMLHAYSLIHDDLPCMDDDDQRRGRPTVHVAYDEATAVLAGDALLTEAFAVLADAGAGESAVNAGLRLFAVARLARAAGAVGLVGGQVDDLAFEAESVSETAEGTQHARLASIHARKTAALFQASIVGGAALGGGNPAQLATLEEFGRDVGIGFQIADDVLDADSEEAASILRLQGIEDARHGAEGLLDRALDQIEGWGEAAEPLRALARFAIRRDR
jgi:geranylgeranyl diphosphate synthase type II